MPSAFSPAWAGSSQSAESLPGHYYLSEIREVGSELLLQADGRFQWMLAYGAVDQIAEGHWTTDGITVTLIPRQAGAESIAFRLGEKADWGERATHFLAHRREAEALQLRERHCPLSSLSGEEAVDIASADRALVESGDVTPPASVVAAARNRADQARATAQAALDQLKARPGWQKDVSLVEEADWALSEFREKIAILRGIYDLTKTPGSETVPLDFPSECRLSDWEKEAAAFRGVAIHVFDQERYLRGDGVRVDARYDKGPVVSDIVSGGYAFFPLNDGQRLTAITLFAPGTTEGSVTTLPVALARPSVQLVNADLGAMVKAPFDQMVLVIKADGALASETMMPGGVYRKPAPPSPTPASIPADPLEHCTAGPSPDAETTRSLSVEWEGEIGRRLASAQHYPPEAARQGTEGTVYLKLRVERSGRVTQIAIDRSSGSALLDEAAMKAVRLAQRPPRIPCDLPDEVNLVLPVRFLAQ